MNVWRLPGPERFVRDLYDLITAGSNVAVVAPAHLPAGLKEAVQDLFNVSTALAVFHVEAMGGQSPAAAVAAACFISGAPPTPEELARSGATSGIVVWIELPTGCDAGPWVEYLGRYAYEGRQFSSAHLGRLVLVVPPAVNLQALKNDPAIRVLPWSRRTNRMDTMLLASRLVPHADSESARLATELRIALMVELSGYDFGLAQRLAALPLAALLAPQATLTSLGCPAAVRADERWALGLEDHWDGRSFIHSGTLQSSNKSADLVQRIWRACLQTVFPRLEELRRDAVREHFGRLRPMRYENNEITPVEDLEFSQIHSLLKYSRAVTRAALDRYSHLRRVRNALAHGDVPTPEDLTASGLVPASAFE